MSTLFRQIGPVCFCLLLVIFAASANAQTNWQLPESVSATVNTAGNEHKVILSVGPNVTKFEIPNLHSPIKSLTVAANDSAGQPTIVPLVDTWSIKIPKSDKVTTVEVLLDAPPCLTNEVPVTGPVGDNTIMIPAHRAETFGEKLRYEPQPWKSTVGYWAVVDDFAVFAIELKKSGSYNVGVLQGCGKDNGGSTATIELFRDAESGKRLQDSPARMTKETRVDGIEFSAIETGHFQDFRWNHVGKVKIPEPGFYLLKLGAKKIKKVAVMDTRTISLTINPKK